MDPVPELPLEIMHAAYNRLTGQELRFKPYERLWFEFRKYGYTAADIELVIPWMQAQNRLYPDRPKSLHLHKLLDEVARFESYRGDAEQQVKAKAAKARAWKASPGQAARAAMCQHEPVPPETEPVLPRAVVAKLFSDMSKGLE